MARIDQGVLAMMVAKQIETVSGLSVVHQREPEPEGTPADTGAPETPKDAWVRVLPMKVTRDHRNKHATEPDFAVVEQDLLVVVGPRYRSQFAGDTSAQRVVKALDELNLRQDRYAETTDASHQLDLDRCQVLGLLDEDQESGTQVIGLQVTGRATRMYGDSIRDFMAPRED